MHLQPELLIEAKKAQIKLKRLIEKKEAPLVECKIHGEIYEEVKVIKAGKFKNGDQRFRCKECMRESHKKNYELHKDEWLKKHADYRNNNREKVTLSKTKSRLKLKSTNEAKIKQLMNTFIDNKELKVTGKFQRKKTRDKKEVDDLSDRYVKRKIQQQFGTSPNDIPPEIVQIKRDLLRLKRRVRLENDRKILQYIEENTNE